LAGLFDDRQARRFAYESLVPRLIVLSSLALLLMVAARRFGVPDVFATVSGRMRSYREAMAQRRSRDAAELARAKALVMAEQQRLKDTVAARRLRGGLPTSVAITPPTLKAPTEPASTPRSTDPSTPLASPKERPLTSAERLAMKRRERR
jgi:hypothetical protein